MLRVGSSAHVQRPRGFTLVELMIVVAIIGILAAIAIPKFAELVRKAQEGRTRGNLSAIRSALSIYYSDSEGMPPLDIDALFANSKYLKSQDALDCIIPAFSDVGNPGHHNTGGDEVNSVEFSSTVDTGNWKYINNNTSINWGHFYIGCAHNDSKSVIWNTR
ncbi:MAG: type II secretion system protein [Elusimicrobia bacterium]|nr:type II secretion system protein [Elusimicrobiota bacterium]